MIRSHRVNRFYIIIVLLLVLLMAGFGYIAWSGSSQASVLVEWTTASELDTAGFNLYRSLEPDGPADTRWVITQPVSLTSLVEAFAPVTLTMTIPEDASDNETY